MLKIKGFGIQQYLRMYLGSRSTAPQGPVLRVLGLQRNSIHGRAIELYLPPERFVGNAGSVVADFSLEAFFAARRLMDFKQHYR